MKTNINSECCLRQDHFLCCLLQWCNKMGHWTIQYSNNLFSVNRAETSIFTVCRHAVTAWQRMRMGRIFIPIRIWPISIWTDLLFFLTSMRSGLQLSTSSSHSPSPCLYTELFPSIIDASHQIFFACRCHCPHSSAQNTICSGFIYSTINAAMPYVAQFRE